MDNLPETIVDCLLDEANWKKLAAAGLLGAALYKHPQAINTARHAVGRFMTPPHVQFDDPDKVLPSEANLTDWEYVEKKSRETEAHPLERLYHPNK
jgi:hypothetical protein